MSDLQHALSTLLSTAIRVVETVAVSGGCISDARRVRVRRASGAIQDLFVKSNRLSFLENFKAESDGLKLLGKAAALRIPDQIAVGGSEDQAWLVLDWIEPGSPASDYFERLAISLADLHRNTRGTQIGLESNNFLGAAPQINTHCDCWSEFFSEYRIGFQIRWAADQGLADPSLIKDVDRIVARMNQLLQGGESSTSLLHGDLWSGNTISDQTGSPVLIDPAVYYGNREAEFGMLRLFGSCPGRFYAAYDEAFPLPGGWQRRVNVYVLYHLLNHLNLFGRGYHGQCSELAAEILRA